MTDASERVMVENQADLVHCKVLPRNSLQQTEKDNKDPQVP
jgi:hypothetical protein